MTTYTVQGGAQDRTAGPTAGIELDPSQRAVVEHEGGPLLVLAGPGTGKTTTLIATIVDLVQRRGVAPEQILALTFSRKAAEQLRDRVTARLQRTLGTPLAATFHSFAYSLVRQHAPAETYAAPLRLLSAAQQDVVIRDLLQPTPEAVRWPEAFAEAVPTRGFAHELQMLLARARERGLDADGLVAAGHANARAEWVAAGRFLDGYLHNLDAQSAVDYSDLVARAVVTAEAPRVRAALRARYSWVLVDEYQDTDPSQVALLRALAGDGRNLVVVGDPDQSIYGFRGAEVRGILDFPEEFRTSTGERAPVVPLAHTRRFGPRLLTATRGLASVLPRSGAVPSAAFETFRSPTAADSGLGAGEVEVLHLDTPRAESEHIADRLRRAHLLDGIPWSQMAVLVRSGRASIPGLRRALGAAGVPVEVAADDTPLADEPAVRPLLEALRVVLHLDVEDPQHPHHVDAAKADALLSSPLGGLDAAEIRAAARALHRREKSAAAAAGRKARASADLVREAVADPETLRGLSDPAMAKLRRLALLLHRARGMVDDGVSAEEVLWCLWDGTDWPRRLHHRAVSGGSGASAAHRDLDAICALFEEAARVEEQRGRTSPQVFLESLAAQQIPADTLAEQGVRGEAVRLLTAHRSKGLEWRFVVVAGVQEGVWPDLRRRSGVLRVDELPHATATGAVGDPLPPLEPRTLLAEERRLFYVACTRARQRLLVTAVASPDDAGDQPSPFTAELGVEPVSVVGRPGRPLSLGGLVAALRRTAADPSATPGLQRAAVVRLAALAQERHRGAPLAPAADPAHWWGLRGRSVARAPIRDPEVPVQLSASAVEGLLTCPARWFLEREAGGRAEVTAAQGFGKVVHSLVDHVAQGDLGPRPTLEDLMAHVDRVWDQIPFRTPWSAVRERVEIQEALRKFLEWSQRPDARTVVGTEVELSAEVVIGTETIRLVGYADRLELDAEGRVVVVDFKTSKQHPTAAEVEVHPQLGVYQLAVATGALAAELGPDVRPGGAELVQLRNAGKAVKVQRQQPWDSGRAAETVVDQLAQAVGRGRGEEFPARPGKHCDYCAFVRMCPTKTSGTVLSG